MQSDFHTVSEFERSDYSGFLDKIHCVGTFAQQVVSVVTQWQDFGVNFDTSGVVYQNEPVLSAASMTFDWHHRVDDFEQKFSHWMLFEPGKYSTQWR